MTTTDPPDLLNKSLGNLDWLHGLTSARNPVSSGSVSKPGNPGSNGPLSGEEPSTSTAMEEDDGAQNGDGQMESDQTGSQTKDGKPPFSYAHLIVLALQSSAEGKMTLSQIYQWITENFEYYRNAGTSWKNSIRHNLSLNKCFKKVPRSKDDPGKGYYWIIDEGGDSQSDPKKPRRYTPDENCHSPPSSGSSAPHVNPALLHLLPSPPAKPAHSPGSGSGSIPDTDGQRFAVPAPYFGCSPVGSDGYCSSSSQASFRSNFQLLDSTANSVDLSESFKNLYRTVFGSSSDSSGSGNANQVKHNFLSSHSQDGPGASMSSSIDPMEFLRSSLSSAGSSSINLEQIDTSEFQRLIGNMHAQDANQWIQMCSQQYPNMFSQSICGALIPNSAAASPATTRQQVTTVATIDQQQQQSEPMQYCATAPVDPSQVCLTVSFINKVLLDPNDGDWTSTAASEVSQSNGNCGGLTATVPHFVAAPMQCGTAAPAPTKAICEDEEIVDDFNWDDLINKDINTHPAQNINLTYPLP